ncbi:tetratricopeptide repeat protein [Alicyclobacillus tolerans]|uniref:tetratricopeptide repeat protein n=1 Tax=Alicyclobacillus tolerans TaxID=90970 RepID=UPI003B799029
MKFSSHKLNMLLTSKYNEIDTSKSLRAIASDIGISAGYLALLRNGSKKNPGPRTVAKLSQFFNIHPNELFENENVASAKMNFSSVKPTLDLCDELISMDRVDKAIDVLNSLLKNQEEELRLANLYEHANMLLAVALARSGKLEEGLQIIDKYLETSVTMAVKALAYYERSRIKYKLGYFQKAIEDTQNAIEIVSANDNPELFKKTSYALGIYYGRVSRYALSIIHYEQARRFIDDQNSEENANILFGLGQTYLLMNEPKTAEHHLLTAKGIYEAFENFESVANANHNLSRCKYLEGDYDGAIRLIHQALELHQKTQSIRGIAYDYVELARCAFKKGDFITSKEMSNRAVNMFETINDEGQAARARLIHYEAAIYAKDKLSNITETLDHIIQYFNAHNWLREFCKAQRIYAIILESNGNHKEAFQLYKQITNKYECYLDEIMFTD